MLICYCFRNLNIISNNASFYICYRTTYSRTCLVYYIVSFFIFQFMIHIICAYLIIVYLYIFQRKVIKNVNIFNEYFKSLHKYMHLQHLEITYANMYAPNASVYHLDTINRKNILTYFLRKNNSLKMPCIISRFRFVIFCVNN